MEKTAESFQTRGRSRFLILAVALFLWAFGIRVFGWNFDQGHLFHPDERRIAEAVTTITFSPLQLNPKFFAYGSFPFYVTRTVQAGLEKLDSRYSGYSGAIRTGRQISALWGALTVLLLVYLGSRLHGRRAGLLAGLLLSVSVLHLQGSHFGVNDIPLTFLSLLCLTALVMASQCGKMRWFLLAGLALGLAVATKFSALPLGAAVVTALAFRIREDGWLSVFRKACLLGLTATLAFCVGSPYALLDFKAYSHDIIEQSQMVRNAGSVPYTNQYAGTPKVLYEIREIVFWGLGPFLGLAALWGAGKNACRALRKKRRGGLVLFSWAVPFFLITAWFEVKFPRYLLPLYPLLCLWAATILTGWSARAAAGRAATKTVVLSTLAYAMAFLTIYTRPFTIRQASEWAYEKISPGSRILSQDWDEGFPLPLETRGTPDRFHIVNFSFYEEDTPEKMTQLALALSSSDFVILQTKRLYGATTQNPKVFPRTSRAFALLFNGELGYRLVKEFASRPRLFGIELPSELADESFSVYDHPKAVVFENTRRFTAQELALLLLDETIKPPLTRTQILLARPQNESGTALTSPVTSSLLAAALVFVFLQFLGFSAFVFLRRVCGGFAGLYALAKVIGVLAFGIAAWLGTSLSVFEFRAGALISVAALFIGAALWADARASAPLPLKEITLTELVTSGTFFLVLFLRTLNPEIFWGEKPMDFSFLNTLYRAATLPPPESWCAGTNLSYTYFGHFLVAAIGKAMGIAPSIMFNIGLGVAGWLLAAAFFFAGAVAGKSLSSGLAATTLGLFTGTLAGPFELFSRRGSLDFDYFWATSRIIPPHGINEYPFWSLLFADLHAHLFAMPWAVTFTGVTLLWLSRLDAVETFPARERMALLATNSILFAGIALSSGWSVPTYALLPAFVTLFDLPGFWRQAQIRKRVWPQVWLRGLVVFVPPLAGFVLTVSFWWRFVAPARQFGLEAGPYAPPLAVFQVFGLFIALLSPFLFFSFSQNVSRWRGILVLFLLLILLLDPSALRAGRIAQAPSVLPFFTGLFVLALSFAFDTDTFRRRTAMVAAYAFAIIGGCEVVYVWDRMNTIFKFHLDAWLILSIGAAPVAAALVRGFMPGRRWTVSTQRWIAAAAAALAFFTIISVPLAAPWPRKTEGPDGTLDGTAYLETRNPEEAALFRWINANVSGLPTLAEAFGPSYQDYARGAMHTGFPIVIGWDYHVSQRGRPWRDIERRKADITRLYRSDNREEITRILKHYRVQYVLSAAKELSTYGSGHRERFSMWPDLFKKMRRWGDAVLYETKSAGSTPRQTGESEQMAAEILKLAHPEAVPLPAAAPLKEPRGIALDPDGCVYISDFGNNRVVKLSKGLDPLRSWGAKGSEPGLFNQPTAITVLPDGNVAVLDTWNSRVQILTKEGEFVRQIRGDLFGPRGMTFRKDGSLLLTDTGNHRIAVFDKDGALMETWGGRGSEPLQFIDPVGIAVAPDGEIYVCDTGNGRLQILSPKGAFLQQIPLPGVKREALSEPKVLFSPAGQAFFVLPLTRQILRLSPKGTLIEVPGRFQAFPMDAVFAAYGKELLVIDIEGKLYQVSIPRTE